MTYPISENLFKIEHLWKLRIAEGRDDLAAFGHEHMRAASSTTVS